MNSLSGEGSFIPTISPGNAAKTFTYAHGISRSPTYASPLSAKGSTTLNAPTVTTSSAWQVVVTMSCAFATNQAITAGSAKPYARSSLRTATGCPSPACWVMRLPPTSPDRSPRAPRGSRSGSRAPPHSGPTTRSRVRGHPGEASGSDHNLRRTLLICCYPPLKSQPRIVSSVISHGHSRRRGVGPIGPSQGCETVAVAADEPWRGC